MSLLLEMYVLPTNIFTDFFLIEIEIVHEFHVKGPIFSGIDFSLCFKINVKQMARRYFIHVSTSIVLQTKKCWRDVIVKVILKVEFMGFLVLFITILIIS